MVETTNNHEVVMASNSTPDAPTPECLKAISILIKLPAELRALVLDADITGHISSSYQTVRSPLCIVLAQLSTSTNKSHQILSQQCVAAWEEKERKTFRITDQSCASALNEKTRKDRLAIKHLVFDLEDAHGLAARDRQEEEHCKSLVCLRGHKVTLSNHLKTICFRATVAFLKLGFSVTGHDIVPFSDLQSWLQNLVPAAGRALEQVVIEIPALGHRNNVLEPQILVRRTK
ncbi:hypothetical protein ONS95_012151 [Cadophora gregata]|uniref:uncharacterized protein n=1 Tax=Cadophora gregata TaxID=51156 RepID=UPI0026DB5061|nr:uncharacterized protein ONS95_012151 [Cadophora gregata]KAK0117827.1 hypothetical protein ONS95_012151 [Cadophora gregata]KAK0122882.1 hypothetical protein ONS96_009908 [Cadophora gregata f. sp. sojae]